MTGVVRADPDHLVVVAGAITREGDELELLRTRAAWAVSTLRTVSREPVVPVAPAPVDDDLALLAEAARRLARDVSDLAAALVAADTWSRVTRAVRWVDDTATVRLHELPGLGGLPAPELRELGGLVLGGARTVDGLRSDRVGRLQRVAFEHVSSAARTAGRHVHHVPGGSLFGRAADVIGSPWAVRARAIGGRAVAGVGIAVDVVEGVERTADGDGWGAARSFASAGGGALLLASNPVTVGVGVLVVGGVLVYEHREALGRTVRGAVRAGRDGARRAADAASDAVDGVIDGARRVLGGLF